MSGFRLCFVCLVDHYKYTFDIIRVTRCSMDGYFSTPELSTANEITVLVPWKRMMMAVRSVNSFPFFRRESSLPIAPQRTLFPCISASQSPKCPESSLSFQFFPPEHRFLGYGCRHSPSFQSLVDTVMEELQNSRKRKKTRALVRMRLTSNGELLEGKVEKQTLQKGLLIEFKKDSEKILLAVVQKPDGKKNWMVTDQNGVTSSIKLQQVTFIVPGVENFEPAEIPGFIQKTHNKLDWTLLEFAWAELHDKNQSVTAESFAEIIYGGTEPPDIYSAHLLLSRDEVYFSLLKTKVSISKSVYGPRPTIQVEELRQRKLVKETTDKEFEEFLHLLRSAKAKSMHSKPSKSIWKKDEKIRYKLECLEAFALSACKHDEQEKTAGMILKAMGLAKMAQSAANLLIDIGYFPVHVNFELLKLNVRTDHSREVMLAAEILLQGPCDPDEVTRKDLTNLKVYAIDVDEADELDDALSATRLQDGRIKVWIHVADPSSLVQSGSIIDREAMKRGTSIFLPTATYPMFPVDLAMEGMSLKQGTICKAVTVSVVLLSDGSIAEYQVVNSLIRPTYMLTYETASELLHLNLEEEAELRILSEAASLRSKWRLQQGGIDAATLDTRIKVANPDAPEPSINLYVGDGADPAMRLVSEMMILCGEVIATYGSFNNIPLPYRGQPQSDIDLAAFAHLPEGPVRSFALVKVMRAAEMDFRKPIWHGSLGLPGYVQFTSPIRRYMDLLSHYQVKAFLRGESPPFSAGQLEGIAAMIILQSRVINKLSASSLRYWTLEFLRRQPKGRRFCALILGYIKDRVATLLLTEVGLQASASVSAGKQVGDELRVLIEESHPRRDSLLLKEVA